MCFIILSCLFVIFQINHLHIMYALCLIVHSLCQKKELDCEIVGQAISLHLGDSYTAPLGHVHGLQTMRERGLLS